MYLAIHQYRHARREAGIQGQGWQVQYVPVASATVPASLNAPTIGVLPPASIQSWIPASGTRTCLLAALPPSLAVVPAEMTNLNMEVA